ncbi:MAG: alpha-amylase family glycosyl hydrolase [Candidatus Cryptobacteroides sp.]
MMRHRTTLYAILIAAIFAAFSCTSGVTTYEVPFPEDVVMYQVNPRVFAAEHSFKAVERHLDSIKSLGVNTVWFMPIHPTGQVKSVNSPYCIRDYKGVNPEFGTFDDFRNVVSQCHSRGMCVIIDWVANHTSWDNAWISNEEWYTHDEAGEIISPEGTGWLDVADLNFDNMEMRLAMIEAMKFWVYEAGVDGFRCDAADFVPFDFWKQCCDSLRAIPDRKLLLLAEGKRKDHFEAGFEMNYAWDYMEALRKVFNQKGQHKHVKASSLFEADAQEYEGLPEGCVKLRFTTNHDESAKMSPIREFCGERGSMAAFVASVFLHGGALIYSSQEVGYPGMINFFQYVPVDWEANSGLNREYVRLMDIYNSCPAVRKGCITPYGNDSVLAFAKELDGEKILVLVNVTQEGVDFPLPKEWSGKECMDLMDGRKVLTGERSYLQPYSYNILKLR